MTRQPVDGSTRFASIGYDTDALSIEVEFRSPKGAVYRIKNVPYQIWAAFRDAESKGKYFDTNLKKQYLIERIA